MSTEGLPVSNVVATNVELGPRSTADAANAASSSQAADSAAASADRAWKFSNDAAASAAAAKVSEDNSAAAMANALSKVVTTEQSVAGAVNFTKSLSVNSVAVATKSTPLGTLDLNTFTAEGTYFQNTNANAILANNYPTNVAGSLRVINHVASVPGNGYYVTQIYYPYRNSTFFYSRNYDASTAEWSGWEIFNSILNNDGRYLRVNAYGLGSINSISYSDANTVGVNQFFRMSTNTPNSPSQTAWWAGVAGGYDEYGRYQFAFAQGGTKVDLRARVCKNTGGIQTWSDWVTLWHSGNTTVDANGFIKKASPIVKLFSDGHSDLNEQSQGVTTERIDTGHYIVHGVFGFNSDPAWGGPAGGIEIPTDQNKRPLIWVDYTVLADGDIEIKTYHRAYKTGPEFTRNIVLQDGKAIADGTPIDIPAGRWIDLRVEMPASDELEPNPEPNPGEGEGTAEPEQPAVTETEAMALGKEQLTVAELENGEDTNDEPKE
ncbi:hypothetical protein YERSI8AC_340002 [Enterobacterales bacterium 8AC]|nr:hypothetical protein YERSI8AC_340002 [Enterobacterales bacterium 8AC]